MFHLSCNIYVLKRLTLNGLESFKGNDSPCCNMQAERESTLKTAVECVKKVCRDCLLGFSLNAIPYTSESLDTSAEGFVEKKVIILAAAVLMPVCGRGISGGHDVRAQTSAGGKKTE